MPQIPKKCFQFARVVGTVFVVPISNSKKCFQLVRESLVQYSSLLISKFQKNVFSLRQSAVESRTQVLIWCSILRWRNSVGEIRWCIFKWCTPTAEKVPCYNVFELCYECIIIQIYICRNDDKFPKKQFKRFLIPALRKSVQETIVLQWLSLPSAKKMFSVLGSLDGSSDVLLCDCKSAGEINVFILLLSMKSKKMFCV